MPSYRIIWEIDVFDAPSPRAAALEVARAATLHDDVYTLLEHDGDGTPIVVDLAEGEDADA